MAKATAEVEKNENVESEAAKAAESQAAGQQAQQGQQGQQMQPVQINVDDSNVMALYANFCRVTGSPEELIIDFGLNPQPVGVPKDPIHVTQRIIINYYTAKRLLGALNMSVQRHESVFGVLETDINKRLRQR